MNSMLRIGGLASGLDTDSIVKDLMKIQRMKVDRLYQDKKVLEWRRDDYRSINTSFLGLKNKVFNMKLQSTFRTYTTRSSNENAVTVSATSSASETSYTINSVSSLAKAASVRTQDGQSVSIEKSIIQGSTAVSSIVTDTNNSFQINVNGGSYITVNLTPGKTYDNSGAGKMYTDLAADIQNQMDSALSAQGIAAGTVKVQLTKDNRITFLSDPSNVLSLQEGSTNGVMSQLGISYNTADAAVSTVKSMDSNATLYDMIQQGRLPQAAFGAGFNWNVDISSTQTGSDLTSGLSTDDKSKTFSDVLFSDLKVDDNPGNISVQMNGETYTVVTSADQLTDSTVLAADDGTGKLKLTFNNAISDDAVISVDRHDFSVTLTNHTQEGLPVTKTFLINAYSQSLNSFMSTINNDKELGLSSFYDEYGDKFSITSKWTGNTDLTGSDISLEGSFFTDILKTNQVTEGTDASFSINGIATFRKDNTFSMNGVTFTLKQEFDSANPVTVFVEHDPNKVYEQIEGFVNAYNETLEAVYKELSEERYRDYRPLTDEQKEDMSDKEIEMWEDKAQSGLLKGDSMLSGIMTELRQSLTNAVEGVSNSAYNQLTTIGITTGAYQEHGKLYIDKAKLMEAIEADPEAVMQLFTNPSEVEGEKGLAVRLYDQLNDGMNRIKDRAGSSSSFSLTDNSFLGKQIDDMGDKIDEYEDRLVQVEDRYWRQFTALEKAISQMNQQSAWMAQQFGMGGGQ